MIYCHFIGALGNQMFQYAFARRLSLDNDNEPIMTDCAGTIFTALYQWWIAERKRPIGILPCLKLYQESCDPYALKRHNIFEGCVLTKGGWVDFIRQIYPMLIKYSVRSKFIREGYKDEHTDWMNELNRNGIFVSPECFEYDYYSHAKNKHVLGLCCSEMFFKPYQDIIRSELKIITEPSTPNKKILDEIRNCNAVMTHIRTKASWESYSLEYVERAMAYIAERVENPVYYIFSDNISFLKEQFKPPYNIRYVDINNSPELWLKCAHEDMRLMYSCKHAIVSVSTMSWWGSYLIDNPEKIVIMPKVWRFAGAAPSERTIYPEGSIQL